MAIYSKSRNDLVESCCKLCLHDWKGGVCTGGSTSTVVDVTHRNEVDDYFNSLPGAEVYIVSTTDGAAPIGESRSISDFVQLTGTITVPDLFSAAVAAGDYYSIHSEYPREEVVSAINLAIDMVAENSLVWLVDEASIVLTANTYEYALPESFKILYRVTMGDSDHNFDDQSPVPGDMWKIIHSSPPKLRFDLIPRDMQFQDHNYGSSWATSYLTSTRTLRLEGFRNQPVLTTDASICGVSPAFVVFQAAALLHTSRIRRPEGEYDDHRTQAAAWQDRADIERRRIVATQLPAGSKRVRE